MIQLGLKQNQVFGAHRLANGILLILIYLFSLITPRDITLVDFHLSNHEAFHEKILLLFLVMQGKVPDNLLILRLFLVRL